MLAERHVLVVENEETICTVVADCLADWPGIKVECAHDGITGVKKLQSQKFSLAVIEMMLPGLSGLDVAQAAVNEDIPVLMLSGQRDES